LDGRREGFYINDISGTKEQNSSTELTYEKTMTQKTKQDWLVAGVHLLAELGGRGVKIDRLTKRLGVTKGSFYHHFRNHEEYKISLLDFIEAQGTLQIIERTEAETEPTAKLTKLLSITVTDSPNLEIAFRAWALQDETVREYLERIDGRRIAYIQQLGREITGDEAQANIMGQMFYAMYVGAHHILPPLMGANLVTLYNECTRLYGLTDLAPFK
jgi:AcrR family transcriptional regulator